jgi:predicted RNase H-like HicB family nuclease
LCAISMEHNFSVTLEWDEQEHVWVTHVPSLGGLSSYGDTIEQALENTKEAVIGYLEAAEKEGFALPEAEAETVRESLALTTR